MRRREVGECGDLYAGAACILGRLLFVGGINSILGRHLCMGAIYSRAESIRGRHLFVSGIYSWEEYIRGLHLAAASIPGPHDGICSWAASIRQRYPVLGRIYSGRTVLDNAARRLELLRSSHRIL